jgi:hypothetical protein
MNSNDSKPRRGLWKLSIGLFLVSLVVPVGDGWWGWQVFAAVFWMLPQALPGEPKLFVLLLSGATVNVLLIFSWVAMRVSRLRRFAPWAAGGALILAVVCLFEIPMMGMGVGYWLWLGASFVALRAAYRMRKLVVSGEW